MKGGVLPRREFVRLASSGVVAACAPSLPALLSGCVAGDPSPSSARLLPGLQLYTLRSLLAEDPYGTLMVVGALGYEEVELAGLYGLTPGQMRSALDDDGLRAVSSHHDLAEIRGDWDATLEGALTLGQDWVVCPYIDSSERSPDGYRKVADEFNAAGEAAKAVGLGFAYHNHAFEFKLLTDGAVPYDLLLERCDPGLVSMQMDVFWTVEGGADPLAYFAAHPGRFTSLHVKDRTAAGRMVAVGEGVIDYAGILSHAGEAGIRHLFVEHDDPEDPLESVRTSYDGLVRALESR
ncbi:MAG: sugar phosphate isomerase/epimerase [Gemmatimonadota bacterium]|nr:sugar phosphate isomerase/epimerase [Gemmatimonadota bacterium]MDH5758482.1 sugar phosphate isomerase/epimerase [Gemmatimonadota bacterium]